MIKTFLFPEKFTGYHMLAVMGLFFGTIIAVNITLAVFAAGSWTGLIVKNTYVESQIFDEKKAIRQKQLDMGWTYAAKYSDGTFTIKIKDADGDIINAERVIATFARPTHEDDDAMRELVASAGGTHTTIINLASGLWQVDINVYQGDDIIWSQPLRILGEYWADHR